jgi:hypothetical protein
MRMIYGQAEEVIAWLGPEVLGTSELMASIEQHYMGCDTKTGNLQGCHLLTSPHMIAALMHLQTRPYWTRVWIIQEIVAAHKVTIMCGSQSLSWSSFTAFLRLLSSYQHFEFTQDLYRQLSYTESQRKAILHLEEWSKTSITLLQALDWSSSRSASDSRDTVYALLGVIKEGAGRYIIANYTHSPCVVYCLAVRAMCQDWAEYVNARIIDESDLAHDRQMFQSTVITWFLGEFIKSKPILQNIL